MIFYAVKEHPTDIITATSIDEAIKEYLSFVEDNDLTPESQITVREYEPFTIDESLFSLTLDYLLELLHEDYSHENAEPYKLEGQALKAWRNFVELIKSEFPVHTLKRVDRSITLFLNEHLNEYTHDA